MNLRWVQWEGRQVLLLQDPLRLSDSSVMVPGPLVPLLALMDGTRDLDSLRAGFVLRTGLPLPPGQVESFVTALDEAFLLANERYSSASHQALLSFRSGPFRTPALAGGSYPEDATELNQTFDEYCREAGLDGEAPTQRIVGLISPHIDYARGWRTYALTWQRARAAVEEADLVVVLGTDHSGAPGTLTLTRQSYATPWGTLPTDTQLVDRLADILGEERAFAEEFHHAGEHSIELAAVWLHYFANGKPKRLLPILCGTSEGVLDCPEGKFGPLWDALELLAEVASGPRVLVVAAGDVSHVGPAFGDSAPFDIQGKAQIRAFDEQWLEAACSGNSDLLAEHILKRGDSTRICGAAPIHYMVAALRGARGRVVAYDQCPADDQFGSLVSIAGVLFTR